MRQKNWASAFEPCGTSFVNIEGPAVRFRHNRVPTAAWVETDRQILPGGRIQSSDTRDDSSCSFDLLTLADGI